jgi:hypothetical protein
VPVILSPYTTRSSEGEAKVAVFPWVLYGPLTDPITLRLPREAGIIDVGSKSCVVPFGVAIFMYLKLLGPFAEAFTASAAALTASFQRFNMFFLEM